LLTGRGAFARGSTPATLAAHREDAPPSLREARPGVSAGLEAVFQRMVAKRPDDRFATMNDVVKALRACQDEAGARRRRIVGMAAACAVVMAVGAGVWVKVNTHRRQVAEAPTTTQARLTQPPMPVAPFPPEQAIWQQTDWAAYLDRPATMTNSIGMKFSLIPPGQFVSIDNVTERQTRPYYIGTTEITIGQFRSFVRETGYRSMADREGGVIDTAKGLVIQPGLTWEHPDSPYTEEFPAMELAWVDVQAMAEWLSKKESRTYRIPTVSEWSWAAQAGGRGSEMWYPGANEEDYGWMRRNSGGVAHVVATRKPNPWGLFDVCGNAAEWVSDLRDQEALAKYPRGTVVEDPTGPSFGRLRVLLGSAYGNDAPYLVPGCATPTARYPWWGGRLLCEIEGAPRVTTTQPTTTTTSSAGALP
jgi:formylglycine-generating enzyme required for sulfatase activity